MDSSNILIPYVFEIKILSTLRSFTKLQCQSAFKMQDHFQFCRYSQVLITECYGFSTFFILSFHGREIHFCSSTELPCPDDLENQGPFPVSQVFKYRVWVLVCSSWLAHCEQPIYVHCKLMMVLSSCWQCDWTRVNIANHGWHGTSGFFHNCIIR